MCAPIGAPVKVVWTCDDDLPHDFYHLINYHALSAGLNNQGKPTYWMHYVKR